MDVKVIEAEATILRLQRGDVLIVQIPDSADWPPERGDSLAATLRDSVQQAGHSEEDIATLVIAGRIEMRIVRPEIT